VGQTFDMDFPQVTLSQAGRKSRLGLQLPQRFTSIEVICGRIENRLEQNRASAVVDGDFFAFNSPMNQFAQVAAGFLHSQSFHGDNLARSNPACQAANVNRGGVDFDQLLVVGQLAERRGDSNFLWHKLKTVFASFRSV
jgi:hypothetical protein